jgi:uncharacterized protein (TIGR04141 family)
VGPGGAGRGSVAGCDAGAGLRETIAEFDEVLTRPIGDLDTRLFLRQSRGQAPRWLRDLLPLMEEQDFGRLVNIHSAALLLARRGGYKFVLVFGTGRFALDRGAAQPGFGLRVVVNAVAAGRVISADTRELGGRGKSQRTAMSTAGPLDELGIEPTREWVRQIEGRPTIDFANAVAGGDSLRLNLRRFSSSRLPEKLDQIIERYGSSDYKKDYDFLDYFTRVDDKATRDRLRARLTDMLLTGSQDVSFASPDIDEPLQVDHYVLRFARKGSELPELVPDEVLAALATYQTTDPLKDVHVQAYDSSGGQVSDNHRLLSYVVAEVELDGHRYALSAGQWFVVDDGFVEKVDRAVRALDDLTDALSLDPWKRGAHLAEGDYNALARRSTQMVLARQAELPPARELPEDRNLRCAHRGQAIAVRQADDPVEYAVAPVHAGPGLRAVAHRQPRGLPRPDHAVPQRPRLHRHVRHEQRLDRGLRDRDPEVWNIGLDAVLLQQGRAVPRCPATS